jgi:hypothetical protein
VTYSASTGGSPSPTYYYSLDGSITQIGTTYQSTYKIPELTTASSKSVYVGAQGIDSNSVVVWDVSSSTTTGTPYIFGNAPTLTVDSSINALILNIGQSTGGNPEASTYYYSIDGVFKPIGSYQSPYTIPELTTNLSRSIYVGARGVLSSVVIWDASSFIINKTPYVFGSKPTISLTPGTNKLTVSYSQTTSGTSPTTFFYSLDGAQLEPIPTPSQFDISNLTLASPRSVYVVARNIVGDISSNTVSATPNVVGNDPIIVSVTSGINKLTVTFTKDESSWSPVPSYYYSFDGTTQSGLITTTTFDISTTVERTVYIIVSNVAGNQVSYGITKK